MSVGPELDTVTGCPGHHKIERATFATTFCPFVLLADQVGCLRRTAARSNRGGDAMGAILMLRQMVQEGTTVHRIAFALGLLVGTVAAPVAAAPERKGEAPTPSTKAEIQGSPLAALKVTTEDGYHIEEGLFRLKIKGRLHLLQGLIVKKVDAIGRLPIML